MSTKPFYVLACVLFILAIGAGCSGRRDEQPSGMPMEPPVGKAGGNQQNAAGQGGAIDASGTVYPAAPANNLPGKAEASQPGEQPGVPPLAPGDWLTYTDPQLGFSIAYPNTYVILDEKTKSADISPNLVLRVRFLDKDLANSDTADLQIPAFSIEVYQNPTRPVGAGVVRSNGPAGTQEKVSVGGVPCMKVTLAIMLFPNQFVLCSRSNNVYQFIPAGQYNQQMLDSFKFGK